MSDSVWVIAPPQREAKNLASELGIPLQIAQILVNRKIRDPETAHRFLYGTLDELHDPYLMTGMREAVERIQRAIAQKEKILIFGDYDVDGVLSVVMLLKALEFLGAERDYFIPERLKEGYGIKEKHIEVALKKAARLIISADCGTKASGFVKRAKEHGIDVIITDHHRPGEDLPAALAILNPVLSQSGYPDKSLAGVGVVYKLIQALFERTGKSSFLPPYVKLVSIGTISDIAELRGENRIFVKFGLKGLENVSNVGLQSLIDICRLKGRRISEGDVGFRIGPRINAAGRMGTADTAVRLFFASSEEEAAELVHILDELNSKRQRIEEETYSQALDRTNQYSLDKRYRILMLGCEEWHRGVIGIVASKLKDFFYRPVILFVYEDGKAFGSGRSTTEFSLIDCLDNCRDFFLNYGGHMLAAGCVLAQEKMKPLKEAMNSFASSRITDEDLRRKISIDTRLDFSEINYSLLDNFSLLPPLGVGNPKPIFLTEKAQITSHPQKLQGKHAKFLVRQQGRTFEALGWERGDWAENFQQGNQVDLIYSFQFSSYLGEERLCLSVEDMRK
mgnify:CR=1 FL=1